MTQQVEVRLANGGREVFSASAWVGREDGGLDVLSADNSAPLATVATFARGEWAFASKVVIEGQVDEKLSVGNLTIDLNVEGAEILRNSIAENLNDYAKRSSESIKSDVAAGILVAAHLILNSDV